MGIQVSKGDTSKASARANKTEQSDGMGGDITKVAIFAGQEWFAMETPVAKGRNVPCQYHHHQRAQA